MNCKKCGAQLVVGQIICSNCGEENYENVQSNNFSDINNELANNIYPYDDIKKPETNVIKQNILLKMSSLFALIAAGAMLVNNIGALVIKASLGTFGVVDLFQILIVIIMVLNAFFISNFNLGKNSFYDSKVIFLIFLCIDFFVGLSLKIYFVVFILSLIGFIISLKNKID